MGEPLRVLSLQPFYGGSHRQIHDGWVSHSRIEMDDTGLASSPLEMANATARNLFRGRNFRRQNQGESWDIIFCTDMLNVAELKGLASRLPDANSDRLIFPREPVRVSESRKPGT